MPVENEFKWVLKVDAEGVARAMSGIPGVVRSEIRQGYLTPEGRVRESVDGTGTTHLFTFKYPVAGELRELEHAISREDFDAFWPVCGRTLTKTRFAVARDGVHWDVDLLADGDGVYYALAEAELPRGMPRPQLLPELAALLIAPVDDRKLWSNHALSDPDRARVLVAHLVETAVVA